MAAVITVGCGVVAVVAAQQHSDAQQRQHDIGERVEVATAELDTLRSEADDQQPTLAEVDDRAEALRSMFTPEALTAISRVQAAAVEGACTAARAATRDSTDPPDGDVVAAYAAANANDELLRDLPHRWSRMLDPTVLQAEVDRCAADEQAIIEAEAATAAAAAAAAAPPLSADPANNRGVVVEGQPPCDPSQLTIIYADGSTRCVND